MKKFLLFILFVSLFAFLEAQILVTPAEVSAINTAQSAAEGDLYKDTTNNVFYIGISSGVLKIIGDVTKVDASLSGDGSVANPLGIAPMGAATGQVLSWNGTSWVPVNAAPATTTVTNSIASGQLTTTVNGVSATAVTLPTADGSETKLNNGTNTTVAGAGTTASPFTVSVADASTSAKGVVQLAGDLAGTATFPLIASNAVTTAKILDLTIGTNDIANNAITTGKIADGTIANADIGTSAVNSIKIQDLSIATADLGNAQVTYAKIQNVASQRIIGNPTGTSATASEISLGTGLTFSGTTLTATNTTALWNANKLQGDSISITDPTNGQVLVWNGSAWVPSNAAPATTTVGNTVTAPNSLTTTVNGTTGTSVSMVTGVSNTSSANNLSTTVNGVTGANVNIVNSISNSIASGQLTTTVNGVSATAVTLPTADGSETKLNNGTNTTVAGAGTTASPYTVSVADATTTAKGVVQLAGDLAGTATSPQIAANAVTTAEIANATILNEDIVDNTIASGKILDGTIATADLGNAQVTYAKIQNVASQRIIGNPTGASATASEISLGTGLTFSGTTLTATNTTALWNANKLQGDSISITDPTNGQVLVWNGSAWVPSNAAPATTTVGNTVTAPNSLTTTVNGTTGTSVSMVTGVSNTSSANNLSTTVNGVTGSNVNIVNSISNSIASGQLTTTVNGVSATAVTLPTADGSETKLNNGTNTTVAGAGTTASPYTVSVADATTTAKGVVQLAGDLAGTATSPQIAANAVTTAEIANATILNEDIVDNTIASGKILDGTIATADLGNAQVTYAKIQNVAGQRLIGNPTGTSATASEISLGTGLTFSGTTLTATNTTALWNANKLQGDSISITAPTNGQVLVWNGSAWVPSNAAPATTTVGNTVTAPNSLTTTVNGTTGTSVSMVTGVSNTSSANNLSTTVNGVTGSNVNIVNSISNSIASGQLTTTVNGVSATAVTLPTADGSETKLNNGTNTTVAGAGTTASPYTVSVADATTTAKGVVQLAGDLAGTATSPQIAANAVTTAEIANATILNEDIVDNTIASGKILDGTIATVDLGDAQVTYAKIQNVAGQRLIGNPTGTAASPSEISLGTGLSFTGSVLNATNNGTVTTVTGTAPIVITGTPSATPNVTITRNSIVTGASFSSASNPLVLDAGATNAIVGGANATLTVNNTAALWNANQLQGRSLSSTAPTNGQVLSWNGTAWLPTTAAPVSTTVSNTVTAPNSLTTTVNGTTGTAVSMVTGVSNTSSANNLSTTVNGVTGSNVNIVNSISNSIASGQLTTTVNGVSATAVTLPTADGSETKLNNGTNTTVAGAGTTASPYTVSVADATTTAKGVVQLAGDLAGTATSPQIAANAVTTAEIANATILNEDIVDNTIASGKILDGTIATADLGNAQVTYAKIQNVAGQRLIGNPTGTAASPSEISLGTGLSFTGSVLNATNNGTVTTVTGTAPIVITGTPTATPNVTITRNSIVTGASSSSASNPLVLDAGATNAVVGGANATLTVNNTAALWNANQLQGRSLSSTAPTNGQVLSWNGTAWLPTTAAPVSTTVSNTVTAPNSLTTTVNGTTGTAVSMVTGVSNTSSANNLSTTVNGVTGANVNIVNSISNSIASGQLTTTVNGVSATAVTLPTADGSETKLNNGTNTTVAGAGTTASPYTVSVADATTTAKGVVQLAGDLTGTATSPQIAANAVTTAEILDLTIGTGDVAVGAITSDKILDATIATIDIGNSQVTYAKIQNVAGQRLLGNPTGTAASPSEISLGTGLSFTGSVLNATNNGTVTTVTGTAPIVITGTPSATPNVTITRNNITTGTSSSSASAPLVLDAGATNAVVGGANATLTVNNTAALWNANQLQGNAVSSTAPTSGQVLSWNGTSWTPTSSPGWSITGNATTNPLTNFIGTTDNQRLVFRTNNVERATFLTNGNFGVGITAPDATVHNNGSSINTVRAIANKPTGGNIETAANSVDIGSTFSINQTTAGQTLTIPSPTVTTAGRLVKISNIGSVSFKMANIVLAPSKYADFLWTGSAWIPAVAEAAPTLTNKNYVLSAEYAGAVLVPGPAADLHRGNMNGDNTGASAPLYMNYYEWQGRSGSGAQTYQVIVRITLPNDFTEWQTNAMQLSNMANTGCSVTYTIYNVSSGAAIYSGSALTNTSWTVTTLSPANLSTWVTPGQTVAMVITFSSTLANVSRVGDIVLNYK